MDPVVCEQEGGEEDQGEEEVGRGREGEGELGHPTPHNGEGRGITLGENLEEEFAVFFLATVSERYWMVGNGIVAAAAKPE